MKKELIDLLDEVSNPDVIIISSALKTTAAKLLKSINSDALNESPDVNEHEQSKEVCDRCAGKPGNEFKTLCGDCWQDLHGM